MEEKPVDFMGEKKQKKIQGAARARYRPQGQSPVNDCKLGPTS